MLGFNLALIIITGQWRNPDIWRLELENIFNAQATGGDSFNFLSNIGNENIRNALKGRPATASLLASEEDISVLIETSSAFTTNGTAFNNNFPIGTNSIPQSGIQEPSVLPYSISHIGTTQVNSDHISTIQVSTSQVGVPQVSMVHFSTSEIGITQVGTPEIELIQASLFQVSTPQVSVTQDSSTQCNAAQISSFEVGAMDNYAEKLSLPIGITLEQFLNLNYPAGIAINTPILHSGITEKGSFLNNGTPVSPQQVGISQVGATQINSSHISTSQVSKTEVSFSQISIPQISTTQVSSPQVGVLDVGSFQTGVTQVGSTEINTISSDSTQIRTFEYGIPKDGYSVMEIHNSSQINTAKVPLSSIISLEKFFAFHNLTLASSNTYKIHCIYNARMA